MKHLFVPYKIALKLKDLDFDEPCFKETYDNDQDDCEIYPDGIKNSEIVEEDWLAAPLYQQVIDWLISIHNMFIGIDCYTLDRGTTIFYQWEIRKGGEQFHIDDQSFNSYYEALNNGIERALEYVEEKNGIHKDT